jgi:hypothetical protein
MSRKSVAFSELPPKHEKRTREQMLHEDYGDLQDMESLNKYLDDNWEQQQFDREKQQFDEQYDKQYKENAIDSFRQEKALKMPIMPEHWKALDHPTGPKMPYPHPLQLQEGPELEANINALTNKGLSLGNSKNPKTKGIWGGKRKTNKRKLKTKSRKTNKRKTTKRKINRRRNHLKSIS